MKGHLWITSQYLFRPAKFGANCDSKSSASASASKNMRRQIIVTAWNTTALWPLIFQFNFSQHLALLKKPFREPQQEHWVRFVSLNDVLITPPFCRPTIAQDITLYLERWACHDEGAHPIEAEREQKNYLVSVTFCRGQILRKPKVIPCCPLRCRR